MNSSAQQPMIVKYLESLHNGIQSQILSRYAIGYILRGTKYIYDGDKRQTLARGDVFYLGLGHHYIENVPDGSQPYEEVLFYYTPEDLQRILMHLNITYGLNISNEHSHEDCCIKSKLLSNVDAAKENFEQIVYDHIFKDISIEELARLTHRSLTSFKKEFRRHFQMPPHKWFIRQRLMHSRLLLISTSKSISEIGNECTFPNTSHFIKLFKKEYQMTPATYRHRHQNSQTDEVPAAAGEEVSVPEKAAESGAER